MRDVQEVVHNTQAFVISHHTGFQFQARVRWTSSTSDPSALSMLAHNDDEGVEWVFARDLLAGALKGDDPFTGAGDVQMSADATDVLLYLHSPEGMATLIFPREGMEQFLTESYQLIPVQAETDALASELDDMLADLFGLPTSAEPAPTPATPETTFKEVTFESGRTYKIPDHAPDDLAEWEADLFHTLYDHNDNNDDNNDDDDDDVMGDCS